MTKKDVKHLATLSSTWRQCKQADVRSSCWLVGCFCTTCDFFLYACGFACAGLVVSERLSRLVLRSQFCIVTWPAVCTLPTELHLPSSVLFDTINARGALKMCQNKLLLRTHTNEASSSDIWVICYLLQKRKVYNFCVCVSLRPVWPSPTSRLSEFLLDKVRLPQHAGTISVLNRRTATNNGLFKACGWWPFIADMALCFATIVA